LSSTQTQTKRGIKPGSLVYWLRFFLAICAGFATRFLGVNVATFGDFALIVGIGVGVIFYVISVLIVRHVLHYGEVELKGKNRYITLGGGTFIVVWVMVSVLLNSVW
jgi:hypothetical protein